MKGHGIQRKVVLYASLDGVPVWKTIQDKLICLCYRCDNNQRRSLVNKSNSSLFWPNLQIIMPRRSSIFACFGRRSSQPDIQYEPDKDALQPVEFALPMPDENELNLKFSEIVVSRAFSGSIN